jgi:hypothetical protein
MVTGDIVRLTGDIVRLTGDIVRRSPVQPSVPPASSVFRATARIARAPATPRAITTRHRTEMVPAQNGECELVERQMLWRDCFLHGLVFRVEW